MNFKILCLSIWFLGFNQICNGQQTLSMIDPKFTCWNDCGNITTQFYTSEANAKTKEIINKILSLVEIHPDFKVLAGKDLGVNTAYATISSSFEKIICVNEVNVNKIDFNGTVNWTYVFILAHEIGHHLAAHRLNVIEERQKNELDADKFAGSILEKLGAGLIETQDALNGVSNTGCKTHPPKKERIEAATLGWNNSNKGKKTENASKGTLTDPKNEKCEQNNTGDVCVVNLTNEKIIVAMLELFNPGDGGHHVGLSLSPGQTQCAYDKKVGSWRYKVFLDDGKYDTMISFGEVLVEKCQSKTVTLQ